MAHPAAFRPETFFNFFLLSGLESPLYGRHFCIFNLIFYWFGPCPLLPLADLTLHVGYEAAVHGRLPPVRLVVAVLVRDGVGVDAVRAQLGTEPE